MAIFVNYEGPKLATEQKQAVRSHVMVLVRGRQKQAKKCEPTCVQSLPTSAREAPWVKKGVALDLDIAASKYFFLSQPQPVSHARARLLARKYLKPNSPIGWLASGFTIEHCPV